MILAGRWSHSRRKFYELHASDSFKIATETVELMAKLWEVKEAAREHSPDARVAARQGTSAAVVMELFALWQKTLPRISGKSKLAEAIRYATSRRSIFECFLSDGGGRTWATIATLLQTAKINKVDPQAWLSQTMSASPTAGPAAISMHSWPGNTHAERSQLAAYIGRCRSQFSALGQRNLKLSLLKVRSLNGWGHHVS